MSTDTNRIPGAPVSGALVRSLREKHALTQEGLALRMGVGGGKSVVSGWETGRTSCEGPAAELLLLLLGADNDDLAAVDLLREMDEVWKRAGNFVSTWRQVSATFEGIGKLDRSSFATLFPSCALSAQEYPPHGFPFVAGLGDVFGVSQSGWIGVIPNATNLVPRYLWVLKRDGRFGYREGLWEDAALNHTKGHIDVATVLQHALAMAFFLRRLGEKCGFGSETICRLRIDLEGVRGKGLVRLTDVGDGLLVLFHSPDVVSNEDRVAAASSLTFGELTKDPTKAALDLVGELGLLLNPDLANDKALGDLLGHMVRQDRARPQRRMLAFLDEQTAQP